MEAKSLAAWCLLVVVLLSTQHRPAAAMSEFCRCYKQCYADCRIDRGPYPCNFECLQDCFNNAAARPTSPADCNRICLIRVCGVMGMNTAASMAVPGGDDDAAAACLAVCRNTIGHSAAPRKDHDDFSSDSDSDSDSHNTQPPATSV